ncbi:DEAD/DEAH box helicase [Vibrio anguillarum]|uniref:ATP-binding domain-containing protein n=1 Tax=Vibrio anguillarum TaxID=55601 RepID=A0ABD4QZX8_VIBAN|nr:ATP-binding domain-containing protein [Vibrio anguillarum]ASG05427.1 DNA helicase [Vibrio anguillarum]MBT2920679.1 ATP-binding domain-containing protein [Vibrio anguillarum]
MTDSTSFFYLQEERKASCKYNNVIDFFEEFSNKNKCQVYLIKRPLGDAKYSYEYEDCLIVLIPNHKIIFLNFNNENDDFDDFYEDFIEDMGSISDKYQYKSMIGRPRKWRSENISDTYNNAHEIDLNEVITNNKLIDPKIKKRSELLISLLTGSINDIERVKENIPDNILDKIKQKILLFDADQTRFVYSTPRKKKTTIQGLSGTGKTELLLHKLKEIYLNEDDSKLLFTCHNKILADSLRKRIPDFFNFMKVEKQIKWDERLWCVHAWGSQSDYNSGAYRYICKKYGISFKRYSYNMPFSKACQLAIDHLKSINIEEFGYAFDYIFIDESQDFPEEFIQLCEMVSHTSLYVAGDIFQSIFDEEIVNTVSPDFLLSKCYRTDPRTLMFSHALGMGLFEEKKLRWLKDREWHNCGYIVDKLPNNKYGLTREPLKRFEDLNDQNIESMVIVNPSTDGGESNDKLIMDTLEKIISNNPTITPDDIGIMFVGSNKLGFHLADILDFKIKQKYGWSINRAYQSKEKIKDTIFFSNKNNVKGLEFPYVICVANYISNLKHERNALYMMLTRSFITTYLIVSNEEEKLGRIKEGLDYINTNGSMLIDVPPEDEQERIKANIEFDKNQESLFELLGTIFDELEIPELWRDPLMGMIKARGDKNLDYSVLKDLVEDTFELMATK